MEIMGIDQYGETYHGLTHPRKELMERLCCQHANKMYIDKRDGTSKHIGYVVAGRWITLYELTPWEKEA